MPGPVPALDHATAAAHIEAVSFGDPADHGRTGIELEWLTFPCEGRLRRPQLATLRSVIAAAGPLPDGATTSFEPGGQLELASAPHGDLDALVAATDRASDVLHRRLEGIGWRAVGSGLDPLRPPERVLDVDRYAAMQASFDARGSHGRMMMCNTAAVQVNVDLGPAAEHEVRWRAANTVGPVLLAAFANSPLLEGDRGPARSTRHTMWEGIDPTRTAPVPLDRPPGRSVGRFCARRQRAVHPRLLRPGRRCDRGLHAQAVDRRWPSARLADLRRRR